MKQINKFSKAGRFLGLLLILYLILTPTSLQAGGFGEQEVRAAVETWVRHVTADARPDAVIEKMEPYQVNGETVAYIAHLKDGGFVLCGADALVLPVYFYSPRGTYDPQNPDYQYILWEIGARLKNLREEIATRSPIAQQSQDELSKRALYWQDLIAGRIPNRIGSQDANAEPLMMKLDLTSRWSQRSPYNDQCPELLPNSGNHTPVGCVATAMAQVMYYWKWPNTGVGNTSVLYNWRWRSNWDEEPLTNDPGIPQNWGGGRLEWTPTNGGRLRMNGNWDSSVYGAARQISNEPNYRAALETLWNRLSPRSTNLSANFGATNYNWSIMQDTHTDPPDAADVEVAKLSHHVGIAVEMSYGIWQSGANLSKQGRRDVVEALQDYFRYDPDIVFTDPKDTDQMIEEIQWLRPIVFEGSQPNVGAHAWVVYGYNKATDPIEFWVNMGGGGSGDGWYSCDEIGFNLYQKHVSRIAPLNVVKFVGDSNPGDGSPDNPYEGIEEAINAAPGGATLIFKAGSDNTFSASILTIDRPFTLKGKGVTIRKQ
jgi:hypothetical protein